jgi:hypothetical protein
MVVAFINVPILDGMKILMVAGGERLNDVELDKRATDV